MSGKEKLIDTYSDVGLFYAPEYALSLFPSNAWN